MDNSTISPSLAPVRPLPRRNAYVNSAPFWDGLANGELVLQYCTDSGRFQHYPKPVSGTTGRRGSLEWREVAGTGTIYACTVVRISNPNVEGRIPLCVATVELDEGVRIIANLLNCTPEQMAIGRRVSLVMDSLAEGHPYPAFELI
jgi:hypothetical protein